MTMWYIRPPESSQTADYFLCVCGSLHFKQSWNKWQWMPSTQQGQGRHDTRVDKWTLKLPNPYPWHSIHTHTYSQTVQKQTWHDRSAALPNLCFCFFSLHLTGDSPQFRIILARQVDVTRCLPDRLIWINSAEETGRRGKICLHYDRKRGDGIQPRGSFLYASLIKCLTAPVDWITDCWTKSVGVKAVGNESVFEQLCLDSWIFRGLTALGLWQVCHTSSPTHAKCKLPPSFPSPSFRKAEGSCGIRGQTWRKMPGKKKAKKTKSWRKKRDLVRG